MVGRIRSGVVACFAACVMAGALAPSRLGAQNIEPSGPPTSPFVGVGPGWYSDVGQVFLAGGPFMTSFSFWLGPALIPKFPTIGDQLSGVDLIPYVMAWNGTEATDLLFQGDAVLVSGSSSYQEHTFSIGSITVSPGTLYVAFLQAVNDGVHVGNVAVGYSGLNGGAVADNKVGDPVGSVTQSWSLTDAGGISTAFAATFSDTPVTATPEPATMMLVGTGLAGIFGMGRLRRKRR